MKRFGQNFYTNGKNGRANVLKTNLMGISLLCETDRIHLNFVNKENKLFKSASSGIDIAHIVA